jgi:ABC-type multidrug transport system permease subunit
MPAPTEVKIVGVEIPFFDVVVILAKWSLAAIPAAIIVGLTYLALAFIFGTFVRTLAR